MRLSSVRNSLHSCISESQQQDFIISTFLTRFFLEHTNKIKHIPAVFVCLSVCSPSSWVNVTRGEMEMHLLHETSCFRVERPHSAARSTIGLQRWTGSLPSGENGGSLWRDVRGTVKRRLNRTENKNLAEKMMLKMDVDQTSSPSLGQVCWWPSSVGGLLVPTQPGPKKKQILLFAPRACGAVPALFTRTGRWPLTYYLVLASLSLSQRDLHQQGLSGGLFYLHADCVVLLLCLTAFRRMSGVLWRFMETDINFLSLKPWDWFLYLSAQSANLKTYSKALEHWNYKKWINLLKKWEHSSIFLWSGIT